MIQDNVRGFDDRDLWRVTFSLPAGEPEIQDRSRGGQTRRVARCAGLDWNPIGCWIQAIDETIWSRPTGGVGFISGREPDVMRGVSGATGGLLNL